MVLVYITLAILVVLQLGCCLVIYGMKQKLKKGLFIRRENGTTYLEDEGGDIIGEKIKINIK